MISAAPVKTAAIGLSKGELSKVAPIKVAAKQPPTETHLEPIAIVSMGCVLPGAKRSRASVAQSARRTSGIVDLRTLDPLLDGDLIGGTQTGVLGDKSYSALAGYAADVAWQKEFPFTKSEFEQFSKAQRLLAEALRQARLAGGDPQSEPRRSASSAPRPTALPSMTTRCLPPVHAIRSTG